MRAARIAVGLMLIGPIALAFGDVTQSTTEETQIQQTPLTATERTRAEAWGMTETEWRRYQSLMQGIRSSVSPPTLSPLEVLGIHARDEAERTRYAEQWALAMRDDAERILAFQRAYDDANRRLFPNTPLIDRSHLPQRSADVDLQPTDRVWVFVRPSCAACDALVARILLQRQRVSGIDIFVAAVGHDEQAVRTWAQAQHIDPTWVHNGQVTLNFADAAQRSRDLPYLMRRRGDALSLLSDAAF